MTIFLITLSSLCFAAGLIGCIIPIIPGPSLTYTALLLIHFSQQTRPFSMVFLIVFGILTAVASLADNVLPLVGARLYGATKYGMIGSIIGMILGILFFPPFGMILGIFIGAIAGELIGGQTEEQALRAGLASFVTSLLIIALKIIVTMLMAFYYLKTVINLVF